MLFRSNGLLEGIPGGMFDWGEQNVPSDIAVVNLCLPGQWDNFFHRFNASVANGGAGGMSSMYRPEAPQQEPQVTPEEYFTPNAGE